MWRVSTFVAADYDAKAERGIVFIDEIDKLLVRA
jgi:ATP-dependent protease Clp ATPase subunit